MKKKNKLMLKTFFKVMFKDQEINSIIPQAYQKSIYDINYNYYISQCKKIINDIKPKQLNLFNFDEL